MNKYKVAETIVSQLILDLTDRLNSGVNLKEESTKEDLIDKWEDIIISELEKSEK